MGQIVIEIPQNESRIYRIVSEASAKKLLLNLERLLKKEVVIDDEDILSLWTVPQEEATKTAT